MVAVAARMAIVATVLAAVPAGGQVLLDRVLARVGGVPITLSDLRAALGIGLVVARPEELDLATEQLVQRRLLMLEVERFPPAEPEMSAIDREEARLRDSIGAALPALATQTGFDARQLRQIARDTLRIRAYLDQRFGETVQVSDEEARAYYAAHTTEFVRDGAVIPFEQAAGMVRQRASAARRQSTIDQWMADLRQRSDVVLIAAPSRN